MTYTMAITLIHTAISLVQIPFGLMAMYRLFRPAPIDPWTRSFLVATFLTAFTGFLFPFGGVTPALIFSVLALLVLAAMALAWRRGTRVKPWSWIYPAGMVISLYLDVFVGIVQAFLKIDALHQLAPTGSEPPFAAAQAVALVIFLILGVLAVRRYRP